MAGHDTLFDCVIKICGTGTGGLQLSVLMCASKQFPKLLDG